MLYTDRISIDGELLGEILNESTPRHCLDFQTGNICLITECDANELGEGRPGVRAGKRFIHIPAFDELVLEEKHAIQEPVRNSSDQDVKESLDTCDVNDEIVAGSAVAMRWLANLKPACPIDWIDEALGGFNDNVLRTYDPFTQVWTERA